MNWIRISVTQQESTSLTKDSPEIDHSYPILHMFSFYFDAKMKVQFIFFENILTKKDFWILFLYASLLIPIWRDPDVVIQNNLWADD